MNNFNHLKSFYVTPFGVSSNNLIMTRCLSFVISILEYKKLLQNIDSTITTALWQNNNDIVISVNWFGGKQLHAI